MTNLVRDLIEDTRYGDRVIELLREGRSTTYIVEKLRGDPVFMERLEQTGAKALFPTDVIRFTQKALLQTKATLDGAMEGSKESAAVAILQAKDRILSSLALFSDFEPIARRGLNLVQQAFDEYEGMKQIVADYNSQYPIQSDKRLPEPLFPGSIVESSRKAMATILDGIRTLRSDGQLQALVRAQTVNVKQGMAMDEVHDFVFECMAAAGLTKSQAMEAMTKAMIARKANKRTAPVEDAKWKARAPFLNALEESQGLREPAPATGAE